VQVTSEYPADAAFGGDFISGAAKRTLIDTDDAGNEVRRDELIVMTDRFFDTAEQVIFGRVCLSEQTIRSLAGTIGIASPEETAAVRRMLARATSTNDQLQSLNRQLREALDALMNLPPVRAWLAERGGELALDQIPIEAIGPVAPLPEVPAP